MGFNIYYGKRLLVRDDFQFCWKKPRTLSHYPLIDRMTNKYLPGVTKAGLIRQRPYHRPYAYDLCVPACRGEILRGCAGLLAERCFDDPAAPVALL